MGCYFMYEVKLPTLDWFMHGNVYTGSFRPDPAKGCLCQTTFNYKVKIIQNKDEPYLASICFLGIVIQIWTKVLLVVLKHAHLELKSLKTGLKANLYLITN